MNRRLKKFLTVTAIQMIALTSAAQNQKALIVADATNRLPLAGVNLTFNHGKEGMISSPSGKIEPVSKISAGEITLSCVGYTTYTLNLPNSGQLPDTLFLQPVTIGLREVNIVASIAPDPTTPVTAHTLTRQSLDNLQAGKAFPEVMRELPSVYATRTGGGFGDATLSIRGFSQENITILLNGVPVNSVENGLVYWNNWEGLSEATSTLQVQKGIGASSVAINSIGGTVNILTKTTEAEKSNHISYNYTSYGAQRLMLGVNSGVTSSGWAFSFLGSRSTGSGFVDGTDINGWSYLISAGKEFGKRHKLVFTLMGSPERHGQRNFELSKAEVDQYGLKYSKDWGYLEGKKQNLSENFYHKPYFTVNHYFDVNPKLFISTSLYATTGTGGGVYYENFSGDYLPQYRTSQGLIDWDGVIRENRMHEDYYISKAGDTLTNYSKNVLTDFRANHWWAGILSSAKYKATEKITLTAGVHARYFESSLWEEITNLLGGEYFIDDYAWTAEGASGRDIIKKVGDRIRVDNGARTGLLSAFGQMAWDGTFTDGFISASISENWYDRVDHYNYVKNTDAEGRKKLGYDIKAGISRSLTPNHILFINGGYFNRAPYYKFVYPNWNNISAEPLKNEKVLSAEVGYLAELPNLHFRLSGYYTLWKDKSVLSNEYKLLENASQTRAMITGLDALHYGLEAELSWKATDRLSLKASYSIGNWEWQNDVSALLVNQANQIVDTVNVYAKGLKVGGAPQTQASFSARFNLIENLTFGGVFNWYDRIWASFDPAGRTNSQDREQSWRIPSYTTTDLSITYKTLFFSRETVLNASCNNLFNQSYILTGTDGQTHTENDFRGFWGYGRTFIFSVSMTL